MRFRSTAGIEAVRVTWVTEASAATVLVDPYGFEVAERPAWLEASVARSADQVRRDVSCVRTPLGAGLFVTDGGGRTHRAYRGDWIVLLDDGTLSVMTDRDLVARFEAVG